MQGVCGKARLVGRQAIGNLQNVGFKSARDHAVIISGNALVRLSQSSSQLGFSPSFPFWKEYSCDIGFSEPSKSNVIPSMAKSSGPNCCASQVTAFSTARLFISTAGNPVGSVVQDASTSMSDVPQRIKFKRLDKTARHIMQIVDKEGVEEVKTKREIPDIKPGYIVQLKVEVPENKRRVSILKGIVIARRNAGLNTTFRIRRLVAGVGVESLFPLYSPNIKEIKVLDKKKVRRAKLYYLRDKMNALKKH